jgi:hypothetical protein
MNVKILFIHKIMNINTFLSKNDIFKKYKNSIKKNKEYKFFFIYLKYNYNLYNNLVQ